MKFRIGDRVKTKIEGVEVEGEIYAWDLTQGPRRYFFHGHGQSYWSIEAVLELIERPLPAKVPRGSWRGSLVPIQ